MAADRGRNKMLLYACRDIGLFGEMEISTHQEGKARGNPAKEMDGHIVT